MSVEGTCEACGSTTSDYNCLNCIMQERDRLKEEVSHLERTILEKPDIKPPIPGEAIEKFQRLWEACVGLAEKADFKAIFNYAWKLEQEAQSLRDIAPIVIRHKDFLVAMGGLDAGETDYSLRNDLFKLVELAESAQKK